MNRSIYIMLLALVVMILSCDKEIPSSFSIDDLPDAPTAPVDLKIVIAEGQLDLTWGYDQNSVVKKYLIYRATDSSDSLSIYDSTTAMEYSDRRVQTNVRYYYAISVISNDDIEGNKTPIISAIPGIYSFLIVNDNEYTNSRDVTVNCSAPSSTGYVMISNTSDFTGAIWRDYAETIGWKLTKGDGAKTVYAIYRDAQGFQTDSVYSDEIILDTRAEIDTLYITPSQADFSEGDKIHFVVDAGESEGDAQIEITGISSMVLYDNGSNGDAVSEDGIYELDYTIPPQTEVNDASVTASFTDRAGNSAPERKLPFVLTIANPPIVPELHTIGSQEDQVQLSWFIPYLNDFDQYRLYRDDNSSVDEDSKLITIETVQSNTTYTDTDLDPSTTYYYRLYVYDLSGLSTASNVVNRKTLANENPEAVSVAIVEVDSTSFRLSWTRNDDDDFASYRIYRDTQSGVDDSNENLLSIENSQSTTTYSDNGITVGQTYYYKVYVFDKYGASTGSNEVSAPK